MAKTLIIPDIHNKIAKADAILAHESHDTVIFLGDYFDDFNDTTEDAHRTALWLKKGLSNPKHIYLAGNHDISYSYSATKIGWCPGFEYAKDYTIWQILNREDFDRLCFYHVQDGVLFSHSGLSMKALNQWTNSEVKTLTQTEKWLKTEVLAAQNAALVGIEHRLLSVGWSRGGHNPIGGLTWADYDIDFLATEFPQIMGHTPHNKPDFHFRELNKSKVKRSIASEVNNKDFQNKSWGLDLDTHLNHYATLEDGILIIKEIAWSGLGNKNISYSFEIFEEKIV